MRPRRHFRAEPLELEPRSDASAHAHYKRRLAEAFELEGITWKQRAQLVGLAMVGRLLAVVDALLPFLLLWALWQLFSWVSP